MPESTQVTRPGLEWLEERLAPAGNVLVTLQAGNIVVQGDSQNNGVEISAGTGDQVVFRGLDGTRVNGATTPLLLSVPGGLNSLNVDAGNGDDEVVITQRSESDPTWPYPTTLPDLFVAGDVNVQGGRGDDVVLLRDVSVGDDLNIGTSRGEDIVVLENVTVAGDLSVDLSREVDRFLVRNGTVGGATTVLGGAGADAAGLIDSTFAGAVVLDMLGVGGSAAEQASIETCVFAGALTLSAAGPLARATEDLATVNTINGAFTHPGWQETLELVANTHFEYEGDHGPDHWGELTPAFLLTNAGRQQTPVAITTATAVPAALPALSFAYQNSTNLGFVHNGHTVQVNYPTGSGNVLNINGHAYNLLQLHFHASSEHTIDGVSYPLELHLVHSDASGNLLVVTVFIEQGPTDNPSYAQLVANLPSTGNPSRTVPGPFNAVDLLPTNRQYFAYSGSLTTPPGSEGVSFALFTTRVSLSAAQIQAFTTAIGVPNHRPVQPLNGRVVFVST